MEVSPELFPSELEPALAEVLSRWPLGEKKQPRMRVVQERSGETGRWNQAWTLVVIKWNTSCHTHSH